MNNQDKQCLFVVIRQMTMPVTDCPDQMVVRQAKGLTEQEEYFLV